MASRRTAVNMADVQRSVSIYLEMQRCTDEASYQKLLAEDDALRLSQRLPKLLCRSLEEFRQPFVKGAQDTALFGRERRISWSDDDYDSHEAMIT